MRFGPGSIGARLKVLHAQYGKTFSTVPTMSLHEQNQAQALQRGTTIENIFRKAGASLPAPWTPLG